MNQELVTSRLKLRNWKDSDFDFALEMHLNPLVTRYFYGDWNKEFIKMWVDQMKIRVADGKLNFWVIETKNDQKSIGFIGMDSPDWVASFTPCHEIGWRISPLYWGKGYATEASKSVLDYALNVMNLKEIVAFAVPENVQSINIMEKLGMKRDSKHDFLHPEIPSNHPLAKNVLYRISQKQLGNVS